MAIRHKRKNSTGYTWQSADLVEGQIGLNIADGTAHVKKADNSVVGLHKVPAGGVAGEYLQKNSSTDFDMSWTDRVNAKTIFETVKNVSGGSLAKGTPVTQVGVTGLTITVVAARADDPTKLAIGVLDETLADEAEGRMIVLGEIKGVNTAGFATGDKVYLGATGGYTNVKPTATDVAVQFLGIVNRVDAANGSGFITGTFLEDQVRYTGSAFEFWDGSAWVEISGGSGISELADDTTPQLGGNLDVNGNSIVSSSNGNIVLAPNGSGQTVVKNLEYNENIHSLGTTSGTITPDAANGNVQTITLNGNLTFSAFSNPAAGQSITLIINTNGTSRTLTSTMKFAGGEKTLSTTSTTDIISVFYDGTNYWASLAKDFK
jgi:hypothetical protein